MPTWRQELTKIRWSYHHRNDDINEQRAAEPPLLKRITAGHNGNVAPEVAAYCTSIKNLVENHFVGANQEIRKNPANYGRPGCVGVALVWLKHTGYKAIQSDKNGAFVLIHGDLLRSLTLDKMKGMGDYRRITEATNDDTFCRIGGWIGRANQQLIKASMKKFALDAGRIFVEKGAQGLLRLIQAAKTHKEKAEVRPLHSSCGSSLAGYPEVLHKMLSKSLEEAKYLVKDSISMPHHVGAQVVPAGAYLAKHDIKDFHMTGNHEDLIGLTCSIIKDRKEREVLTNLL